MFVVNIKAHTTSRRCQFFVQLSILLGSAKTRPLVDYPMFLEVVPKGMVEIFDAIILSKNLNLCLDYKMRVHENITNIRFFFQEIHLTHSGMIINKYNKPFRVNTIRETKRWPAHHYELRWKTWMVYTEY